MSKGHEAMTAEATLEQLRDCGLRITAPRRAFVAALSQTSTHFTADELLGLGREHYTALGRSTVYRMLEICTSLGIVRPLALGSTELSYILPNAGHHHLICTVCNRCFEFDDCAFDDLGPALSEHFAFEIQGHLLEIYGRCSNCREAR